MSPGIQKSFADATVQDVAIKAGHRAAAKFSNGEAVVLDGRWGAAQPDQLSPAWLIVKVGGKAGREFFE